MIKTIPFPNLVVEGEAFARKVPVHAKYFAEATNIEMPHKEVLFVPAKHWLVHDDVVCRTFVVEKSVMHADYIPLNRRFS